MSAPNAQLCLPGQGNEIDFVGSIVDLALGVASTLAVQQTDLNRGLKWTLSSREYGVFFQIGQASELAANKGRFVYATPNTKIVFRAILGEQVKASVTLAGDATAPSVATGLPNAQLAAPPVPFTNEIDYVGAIQQLTLGVNSTVAVQAADINRGLDWILSAGPYGVYFQVGQPAELNGNAGRYFYCLPNQRIVYPAKLGEAVRASYLTDGSAAAPPTTQPLAPPVIVDANGSGVIPVEGVGTLLHLIGADGVVARMQVNAIGGAATITGQRANGTLSAPTHLNADDPIWILSGAGYGDSAYGGSALRITGAASEVLTATAQGAYWAFSVTPRGSITQGEAMRLNDDGSLAVGNAAFTAANRAGAGSIAAQGKIVGASAVGYYLGTVQALYISGNYSVLSDGVGNIAFSLGATADPTNYHSNTTHVFRSRDGTVTYGALGTAGFVTPNPVRLTGAEGSQIQIATSGQEWRINSVAGGPLYIQDVTNGTIPLIINQGSGVVTLGGPYHKNGSLMTTAAGVVYDGGWSSPEAFGCVGDGVTDDTVNFRLAVNSGKPLLLIGKYAISGAVVATLNKSTGPFGLFMQGFGEQSKIILTNVAACLTVSIDYAGQSAANNTSVVLKDFDIVPAVANQGSTTLGALNILGSAQIGSSAPNFMLDNVNIMPTSTNYANVGIFLKDVRAWKISRCNIVMSGTTGSGIVFTSTDNGSTGNAPCDVNITDCHILNGNIGIELRASGNTNHAQSNDWQGVHITGCTLLSQNTNIVAASTDGNSNGFNVANCITSFLVQAITMTNVQGMAIIGNYFQNISAAAKTFVAASMAQAAYVFGVYGQNTHYDAAHTGSVAIAVTSSGSGLIKVNANGNMSLLAAGASMTYTGVTSANNN